MSPVPCLPFTRSCRRDPPGGRQEGPVVDPLPEAGREIRVGLEPLPGFVEAASLEHIETADHPLPVGAEVGSRQRQPIEDRLDVPQVIRCRRLARRLRIRCVVADHRDVGRHEGNTSLAFVHPLRSPVGVEGEDIQQDLARIHDALRVDCTLDGPHRLERDRALVPGQRVALQATDTVLGADAAAETAHEGLHGRLDLGLPCDECAAIAPGRLAHVEVQVTVADVAVGDHAPVGDDREHGSRGLGQEIRQRGDRDRHVVLDTGTLRALRLGHRFAHPPERIALRER